MAAGLGACSTSAGDPACEAIYASSQALGVNIDNTVVSENQGNTHVGCVNSVS